MEVKTASDKIEKGYDTLSYLIWGILVLNLLVIVSRYNYLLFHLLVENFSIIIAYAAFIISWNSRRFFQRDFFLFIGVAYAFIGTFDMLHMASYKGMNIFSGYGANLPTQFWIVARYIESVSLLLAFRYIEKRMNRSLVIGTYTVLSAALTIIILLEIFPACYVEGTGLTLFKKASEYTISLIILTVIAVLFSNRAKFDDRVFKLLAASLVMTIFAELSFTFYISVYGLSNFIGHIFKLASFYLIYKSIIETGLVKPYSILFREVKIQKERLESEKAELKNALAEIKQLSGLLPICSNCKKIRDDAGYWNQLEIYLKDHSDARFTHSICPECAIKLYPDIKIHKAQ